MVILHSGTGRGAPLKRTKGRWADASNREVQQSSKCLTSQWSHGQLTLCACSRPTSCWRAGVQQLWHSRAPLVKRCPISCHLWSSHVVRQRCFTPVHLWEVALPLAGQACSGGQREREDANAQDRSRGLALPSNDRKQSW
jgi:hypothetical protein